MRIIQFIITTFMIAVLYGLYVTTIDFMGAHYDPVASGHRAADNVHALFGTVTHEVKRNEGEPSGEGPSIAYKIAIPYAITADLSAIFGGKIEVALWSLFHKTETQAKI